MNSLCSDTIKNQKLIITSSICYGCKHEIFPDDDAHLVNNLLICEVCWCENVCHRCGNLEDEYIHMACEICNRKIGHCKCLAICWCQSVDCICRDCIQRVKFKIKCDKCKIDLADDLSKESFPTICEDSGDDVLCLKCSKL